MELDKNLKRYDKLAVCLRSEILDEFSDLWIRVEDKIPLNE